MLPNANQVVRSRTHAELLRRYISKYEPYPREVLDRPEVVGSAHWVSVGTVETVLNDIMERFEAGAIDGFIALPGGSEKSMELFFEKLIPKLVERGLFRSEYANSQRGKHFSDMNPGYIIIQHSIDVAEAAVKEKKSSKVQTLKYGPKCRTFA